MLLRPKWMAGHILVIVLTVSFVALGFWQLHRNREKHDKIAAARAELAKPAPDLVDVANPVADTRAQATGRYDGAHQALLRNQVNNGRAGYDVLTPLQLGDGTTVIVDRGWVESPTAAAAAPVPGGDVVVRGLVRATKPLQPDDQVKQSDGLTSLPRVDVTRIAPGSTSRLRPVWLLAQSQTPAPGTDAPALPQPPPPDQVNHMQYAIQWFAFALIPIVGWPIVLVRSRRRQASPA